MHQYRLTRLKVTDIHQCLPCGQSDDWQSSRVSQRYVAGRMGESINVNRDGLGPCSHTDNAGIAVDLVSDGKLCDLTTKSDHFTRQFSTHYLWQVQSKDSLELANACAFISMIDPRGVHAYKHLTRARFGDGHVDGAQRLAVLLQNKCLHEVLSVPHSRQLVTKCYWIQP